MDSLFPLTLEGQGIQLEPLSRSHVAGLARAAGESRKTYGLTGVPVGERSALEYVERALASAARGEAVPVATIDLARNQVVGSTRVHEYRALALALCTWLAETAQRTHVNTAAKLLMLTHAFDVWRVRRVNIRTDARHARSRSNIERIGGRLDGILRAHMPSFDGGIRDTASYSILPGEWPPIRARLHARLTRGGTSST